MTMSPDDRPLLSAFSRAAPLLALALTAACGDKEPADSGACRATCVSALAFTFSDGRETFKLQVSSADLGTLSALCPEELLIGEGYSLECDPGAAIFSLTGAEFDDGALSVSIDDGAAVTLGPDWSEPETICDTTCASATVVLE